MADRQTGIVATVGPASEGADTLEELLLAGVDIFRFSYGRDSLVSNRGRIKRLSRLVIKTGRSAKLMMDLPGRKNRIISKEIKWVNTGDRCFLGYRVASSKVALPHIQVLFPIVLDGVQPGDLIFFGDGEFSAHIVSCLDQQTVFIEFNNPGEVAPGRGVTVASANWTSDGSLTTRDKHYLKQHLSLGFDFVALSFVNSATDVAELKAYMNSLAERKPGIIAKIETEKGFSNLDEILAISDGVMIGRGDLALNIPFEKLPFVQKQIIEKANVYGKAVIVATQMLESISERDVPLRSEITDIATAVYQGASAIMLSGETRTGKRPVYAVQTANKIIKQAEQDRLSYR